MKLFFTIILFVIISTSIFSQPKQEWVARYNSPGSLNDTVVDMEVDREGNVYILGYNQSFITIKYNNDGNQEWIRNYRGPSQFPDVASDLAIDDSGNVYVTGSNYTNNQNPYKRSYVIIKYSSSGDSIWGARFINIDSFECSSKEINISTSGLYLTGDCWYNASSNSFTVLKYDFAGNFITSFYYPNSISSSTRISESQNLYILGASAQGNYKLFKYNSLGSLLFEIPDTVYGYKLYLGENNDIYTSGLSISDSTRNDIATSKYDSLGNKVWLQNYHNPSFLNNDFYRDFVIDLYGNSYVTGASPMGMELAWDIVTLKYNTNGKLIWVERYDSVHNSSDNPESIMVDKLGNVYVTGYTNFNLFAKWYITICYDSTGNQKFVLFYNNGLPFHNHEAKIVKIDNAGNFYVTGVSHNANADYDIATIKYSVPTNIHNISNEIPHATKLHQNYPNPFNSESNITFDLSTRREIEIEILDMLGRSVFKYYYGYLNPGTYQLNFNGNGLSTGIYYYTLKSNKDILLTKKMSFIK